MYQLPPYIPYSCIISIILTPLTLPTSLPSLPFPPPFPLPLPTTSTELVALNKIDSALYLLHEVLVARKYKTWSLVYESVCIYYLTLCVKEGRFREMNDGLHQYRNMTQVAAPGSLSKVCKALVEMSKGETRGWQKCNKKSQISITHTN